MYKTWLHPMGAMELNQERCLTSKGFAFGQGNDSCL